MELLAHNGIFHQTVIEALLHALTSWAAIVMVVAAPVAALVLLHSNKFQAKTGDSE